MIQSVSYKNEVLRKLIHLSSLWMVGAVYLLSREQALLLFGVVFVGMVLFEIFRRYSPFVKKLTQKLLSNILRPHENVTGDNHLTGAFYVTLAVLIAVFIFPKSITISAITIMLLADTAAALVGRKFGKHPLHGKSWEGTAAFFAVSAIILFLSSYWGLPLGMFQILGVAAAAAIIELYSNKVKIDDNLTIVLSVGALLLFV